LLLAQLDTFFRCGLPSESFGTTEDADVEDLRRKLGLARRLPSSPFVSSRVCVLNPSFDKASRLVGGADADVLIDDTLIDVKTTKRLLFTAEMFRQLVGYYVLSKVGGIAHGVRPKPQIRHLAVYFARFGVFASLPVERVVTASNFPAFLHWFKRRATSGPSGPRTTLRLGADMKVTF
jgi:hypothetical protein